MPLEIYGLAPELLVTVELVEGEGAELDAEVELATTEGVEEATAATLVLRIEVTRLLTELGVGVGVTTGTTSVVVVVGSGSGAPHSSSSKSSESSSSRYTSGTEYATRAKVAAAAMIRVAFILMN